MSGQETPGEDAGIRGAKGVVGQLGQDNFSLSTAVGGPRGALESLLPGLVFVVAYVITHDLPLTLWLAGGVAALFVVVRLLQKSSPLQALAGVAGVGVGVIWAAFSGQAENYFAWGLIVNASAALILLLSLTVRRPLVALLLRPMLTGPVPASLQKTFKKRCDQATWVWFAVFAARLAVQLPLFYGKNTVALGTAKLVMGLPLFALGAWATWVLLRNVVAAVQESSEAVGDNAGAEAQHS